jgi:hypothetical protein
MFSRAPENGDGWEGKGRKGRTWFPVTPITTMSFDILWFGLGCRREILRTCYRISSNSKFVLDEQILRIIMKQLESPTDNF